MRATREPVDFARLMLAAKERGWALDGLAERLRKSYHEAIGANDAAILGATKVTGKTGIWTYGGLTALTARDRATSTPAASYNVMRLQRDVLHAGLDQEVD